MHREALQFGLANQEYLNFQHDQPFTIEKPGQTHKTLLFFCPPKIKTHGSGVVGAHHGLHQGDGFGMQTELVQNHTRPELDIQLSVQFQLIVHQLIELEQVIHLS